LITVIWSNKINANIFDGMFASVANDNSFVEHAVAA